MRVEEVLLVVRQAPLGHDRAAAGNDAGDPLGGQRHIAQQHAGVDGEVVDALLGLFDQGIAEDFPGQVLGDAVDLLQRLVDRYGADRYRAVAQDPLAGFMDVLAGGQVHHRVGAPADAPGELLHFFLDRRAQRAVADVAVDLHQEVAADDHRLKLGVVDVRRNDRAAAGDFLADELGGDFLRDVGAEAVPRVLLVEQAGGPGFLQLHVLADGDVFHLRGDDAFLRVVHLRDVGARLGPARRAHVGEAQGIEAGVGQAGLAELGGQAGEDLGVAALVDPARTHVRQALAQIDADLGVGIRAGGVVDEHRRVLFAAEGGGGVGEGDFPHRDADVRARAGQVDLARVRERLRRLAVELLKAGDVVLLRCAHRWLSWVIVGRTWHAGPPGLVARRTRRQGRHGADILFPTRVAAVRARRNRTLARSGSTGSGTIRSQPLV